MTAPAWGTQTAPDPKRWLALVVLSSSLFIIVLDNTILNVAVPTIIRELHTNVSSMQWVISGYSLVFASSTPSACSAGLPLCSAAVHARISGTKITNIVASSAQPWRRSPTIAPNV